MSLEEKIEAQAGIDHRLAAIEGQLAGINQRFADMEQRVAVLEGRLALELARFGDSAIEDKYAAETQRLDREYRWYPWLQLSIVMASGMAAGAALFAAAAAFVKLTSG